MKNKIYGMTKEEWIEKKKETLRELESHTEKVRESDRYLIAALKYDIKKLEDDAMREGER